MSRYVAENEYPDETAAEWRYWSDTQHALEEDQRYLDAMQEPPPQRPPYRESGRRAALFAKAERTLAVAARVAGDGPITVHTWWRHNGQRIGLFVDLPGEREMTWTPRGGYHVGEVVYGDIPF